MHPTHFFFKRSALALSALALTLVSVGCEEYDAPPEVQLQLPENGVYVSGDPLLIAFSEPIDPSTLNIRIWPVDLDQENNIKASAKPHLSSCTVATSPCDTTTLSVSEDNMVATLQLDPDDLGKADIPILIEVLPGLTDAAGNDRSAKTLFDVQFSPTMGEGGGIFQNGHYFIVGQVTMPLPASLRLVTDFRVEEDGSMAMTGAQGALLGDAIKNTENIDDVEINTNDDGFTIHAVGQLTTNDDGDRFIESEPFQVDIALGSIKIALTDVTFVGKVIKDDDGNDFIDATLSYGGVTLDTGTVFEYEGGTTTVKGIYVPPDKLPPNGPSVCGDPCGQVPQCNPPAEFPGDNLCLTEE